MNALDLPTTLLLTQRVLGAGLLIQSAEVFVTRRIYERGGALGDGGITPLVLVRAGLALLLVIAPGKLAAANLAVALFLLMVSSVWLTVRTRGPLCGGSDSMFFQVQLGLFVASLGFVNPLLPKIGLGWIAAQSVLSYFLAGFAKLKNVGWRNGVTMQHLFTSDGPYVLFEAARSWGAVRPVCVGMGWLVLGFELLFPLVLVLPMEAKLVLLGLGLMFHFANAALLGLNRFIWAWAATYPALLYFQ